MVMALSFVDPSTFFVFDRVLLVVRLPEVAGDHSMVLWLDNDLLLRFLGASSFVPSRI
jgi:hypothetical protein